jgi:hypothetical protein
MDIKKKDMRYPVIRWQNVLENIKQKCEKGGKESTQTSLFTLFVSSHLCDKRSSLNNLTLKI